MNELTVSLAWIVAEAQALMDDLDGAAPIARSACEERAMRLRLAAESCQRALAAPSRPAQGVPIGSGAQHGGKHALSVRELEVLRLIAAGYRDRQIADALFVSTRTVTTHVTAILNKLAAESRTAAVVYAIRVGLV